MRFVRVIMLTGNTFALKETEYEPLLELLCDDVPFDGAGKKGFYQTEDFDGSRVCFDLGHVEAFYLSTPESRKINAKHTAQFDKERKRNIMELGLEDLSDDQPLQF